MKFLLIMTAILSFVSKDALAKENIYIRSFASKMPYQIVLSIATVNDGIVVLDDYTIKYSKDKEINSIERRTRKIETQGTITSEGNIQLGTNKNEYYCKDNFKKKNKTNKVLEEVLCPDFLRLTNMEKMKLLNQLFANYSVSENN